MDSVIFATLTWGSLKSEGSLNIFTWLLGTEERPILESGEGGKHPASKFPTQVLKLLKTEEGLMYPLPRQLERLRNMSAVNHKPQSSP